MKDLGYLNNWYNNPPEVVTKCQGLKHNVLWENIGICLNKCTCTECDYTYKVDSSD